MVGDGVSASHVLFPAAAGGIISVQGIVRVWAAVCARMSKFDDQRHVVDTEVTEHTPRSAGLSASGLNRHCRQLQYIARWRSRLADVEELCGNSQPAQVQLGI